MKVSELQRLLARNPDLAMMPAAEALAPLGERVAYDGGTKGAVGLIHGLYTERELQQSIVDQCTLYGATEPAYGLLMAIPNGQVRPGTRREPGIRRGVPDLFLPVARQNYHGLFIELKVRPNRPSYDQLAWIDRLRAQGFAVEVIYDSPAPALALIAEYLEERYNG